MAAHYAMRDVWLIWFLLTWLLWVSGERRWSGPPTCLGWAQNGNTHLPLGTSFGKDNLLLFVHSCCSVCCGCCCFMYMPLLYHISCAYLFVAISMAMCHCCCSLSLSLFSILLWLRFAQKSVSRWNFMKCSLAEWRCQVFARPQRLRTPARLGLTLNMHAPRSHRRRHTGSFCLWWSTLFCLWGFALLMKYLPLIKHREHSHSDIHDRSFSTHYRICITLHYIIAGYTSVKMGQKTVFSPICAGIR